MKKLLFLVFFFCLSISSFGQQLQPAPTFRLQDTGYGAAALGMGGAFTAVADDLSAIYWNPAGLAQLPGVQIHIDYRFQGDSDEDFAEEVFPNRFESKQRFEVTGKQFQDLSASYSFTSGNVMVVPAFAWHKVSSWGPERNLKETAGVVEHFEGPGFTFFQSEGDFSEKTKGGDEELAFAVGAQVSKKILIGGSWSFLIGGPEENLTGTFHDSFITDITGTTNSEVIRTDIDLDQTRKEEYSGNYLKLGVLLYPQGKASFGGYVRLPYTRKSQIRLDKNGTFVRTDTIRDVNGNVITVDTANGNLDQTATASAEIEFPLEWSAGVALRGRGVLVSGSITYSDWKDVQQMITDSSDPLLIPETTLPYPGLRAGSIPQYELLQWRGGIQYTPSRSGRGLMIRSGYFRDGQPFGNESGDRVYFKGYSFGAGFATSGFRFDVAYVRETGEITFTPTSRGESNFKNRRWVFSVDFLGT